MPSCSLSLRVTLKKRDTIFISPSSFSLRVQRKSVFTSFTHFQGALAPMADFGAPPAHTEILLPLGRKHILSPKPPDEPSRKTRDGSKQKKRQPKAFAESASGSLRCFFQTRPSDSDTEKTAATLACRSIGSGFRAIEGLKSLPKASRLRKAQSQNCLYEPCCAPHSPPCNNI